MNVKQGLLALGLCCFGASAMATPYSVNLVKNFNKGQTNSFATELGNSVYSTSNGMVLLVSSADGGYDLWVSDGSSKGSRIIKDIYPSGPGIENPYLFDAGDKVYFTARKEAQANAELWVTDGTEAGTYQISAHDTIVGYSTVLPFKVLNDELYYYADDGIHGFELYKTNGQAGNAQLVKDINPGPQGSAAYFSYKSLAQHNGLLYFSADDGVNGSQVHRTDGTTQGTELVVAVDHGSSGGIQTITSTNSQVFFDVRISLGIYSIQQSWVIDALSPNGRFLAEHPADFVWGSYNRSLPNADGSLLFSARDEANGMELWIKDGSVNGNKLLKDIYTGDQHSYPNQFTHFDSKVYFIASSPGHANELWRTDGTTEGTELVFDLMPGTRSGALPVEYSLTVFDGRLFFVGNDVYGSDNYELWSTDGITARQEADLHSTGSSKPHGYVHHNGKLYFVADGKRHGRELWVLETNEITIAACTGKKCK